MRTRVGSIKQRPCLISVGGIPSYVSVLICKVKPEGLSQRGQLKGRNLPLSMLVKEGTSSVLGAVAWWMKAWFVQESHVHGGVRHRHAVGVHDRHGLCEQSQLPFPTGTRHSIHPSSAGYFHPRHYKTYSTVN
jgi:hypothetical protein